MYEWTVLADDQAGQVGYYPTAYFYTEGGAEVFHKLLETYPAKSRGLPYLGFIPRKLVAEPGMPAGILVDNVGAGTPALQAGIVPGDILTKFNGNRLDHVSVVDYLKMIRAKKVGDEVTLELVQHGKIKSVGATVGAIP
jgi:S1-C subfamily serine protease